MPSFFRLAAMLLLAVCAASVSARTIQIPENKPVAAIDIPNDWQPDTTDHGVGAESPDEVVTIFFEIARSEKQMNALIDDSMEWLTEEHKLKINPKSEARSEVSVGGAKASKIEFSAQSKVYGAAKVGFIFAPVAGKLLVITYWVTAKEFTSKHADVLNRILDSVRPSR